MSYKLKDIEDKIKMKDMEKSMSDSAYTSESIYTEIAEKPVKVKQKQKAGNNSTQVQIGASSSVRKKKEEKKKDKFEIFFIRIAMTIGLTLGSILLTAVLVKLIFLMFS